MREIKFRAWVGDSMIYNVYYTGDNCYDANGGFWRGYHQIMQFTGLKDKNGKEIYEGDILKLNKEMADMIGISSTAVVCWSEDIAGYTLNGKYLWLFKETEVIGNIYENHRACSPLSTKD